VSDKVNLFIIFVIRVTVITVTFHTLAYNVTTVTLIVFMAVRQKVIMLLKY